MQTVAELVKQGRHFGVGQQRRSRSYRRREVAHQLRDGQRLSGRQGLGDHAFVHPGATALLAARIRIEVETRDNLARPVAQVVIANRWVPHHRLRSLAHADAVEPLRQGEKARKDPGQGKVRTQFFLRNLKAGGLQSLAIEPDVPGVELAAGKRLQL